MTVEHHQQTEDKQDAAHELILPVSGDHPIPVRSEIRKAYIGSPAIFYDRLDKRLGNVGIELKKLDYRTDPPNRRGDVVEAPPCFEMSNSDYGEWLSLAAVEEVPVRFDLPGEPNYCNDCTPEFKRVAVKAGTCNFPNTRFEVKRDGGERETIGVSRSRNVPPEGFVAYQQMVVPIEALSPPIREFVRRRLKNPRKKREFLSADLPISIKSQYGRINRSRTEPQGDA